MSTQLWRTVSSDGFESPWQAFFIFGNSCISTAYFHQSHTSLSLYWTLWPFYSCCCYIQVLYEQHFLFYQTVPIIAQQSQWTVSECSQNSHWLVYKTSWGIKYFQELKLLLIYKYIEYHSFMQVWEICHTTLELVRETCSFKWCPKARIWNRHPRHK